MRFDPAPLPPDDPDLRQRFMSLSPLPLITVVDVADLGRSENTDEPATLTDRVLVFLNTRAA